MFYFCSFLEWFMSCKPVNFVALSLLFCGYQWGHIHGYPFNPQVLWPPGWDRFSNLCKIIEDPKLGGITVDMWHFLCQIFNGILDDDHCFFLESMSLFISILNVCVIVWYVPSWYETPSSAKCQDGKTRNIQPKKSSTRTPTTFICSPCPAFLSKAETRSFPFREDYTTTLE